MDIVHERAAGLDISKHDAKLCLRVPGLRAGTYSSTVTTWGATTGQILELREFLEREHVTTVVMEATSDYWKPFFYLLEETPSQRATSRAGKPMYPTRPGSPSSALTACFVPRLSRRNRSVNCGT